MQIIIILILRVICVVGDRNSLSCGRQAGICVLWAFVIELSSYSFQSFELLQRDYTFLDISFFYVGYSGNLLLLEY